MSAARAFAGSPFGRVVLALAAVRVLIPVVTLAATGHDLPLLPPYDYAPLNGDAQGFYSLMRAIIAAAPHVHPALMLVELLLLVAAALVVRRTWRRPGRRWAGVVAVAATLSIGAAMVVTEVERGGAAVVGWSLVLAVPLFPFRVLGLGPGADLTFAVAFTLSLLCVAVTTVATALLAVRLVGRRSVGIVAAALWALWPLLVAPLAGTSAWENGQWNVDVGLHLYTEPISTALVTTALVLVAPRLPGVTAAAVAGALIGYATVVKLSNGLIGLLVVLLLVVAGAPSRRRAAVFALGGLVWVPLLVAYWPKGYVGMFGGDIAASDHPFAFFHVSESWSDSVLFTPRFLAVLVPPLLLGLVLAPLRARLLLGTSIALTTAFYSLYDGFAQHPRFLYVVVPSALVLVAVALVAIGTALRSHGRRLPAAPARQSR